MTHAVCSVATACLGSRFIGCNCIELPVTCIAEDALDDYQIETRSVESSRNLSPALKSYAL